MSAPGALAYAPTHLEIWLAGAELPERERLLRTKIANDGVPITSDNVKDEWINRTTLRLCLSGDEQEDEVVLVRLDAREALAQAGSCVE